MINSAQDDAVPRRDNLASAVAADEAAASPPIDSGLTCLVMMARRLDKRDDEKICHSGRSFSAEDLANMGLVDVVADTGRGEQAVMEWIKKRHGALRSHQTMSSIRKSAAPLSRADFQSGLESWTDIVMSLDKRRLVLLSYAIEKQRTGVQ